jgi:putative ABC transport system permease protein
MRIDLPPTKYAKPEQQIDFYDRLLAKVETLPGVHAAGIINALPVQSCWNNGNFSVKGRPWPAAQAPLIEHRQVSPGVFQALGIPVLSGRHLTAQDGRGGMKATVISRRATQEFWQGEEPLGQQMSLGTVVREDSWKSIVGVVGDVSCAGPHLPARPVMYEPYWQFPLPNMSLAVRSPLPPERLVPVIRRAVLEIDPDQPVYLVKTMDEVLADWTAPVRFVSIVVSLFTAIAMVLAAVGIYGVLSYVVSRSTHEIGLRMALGASRQSILRHVLQRGLREVSLGICLGVPLALAGAAVLSNLVEGVRRPDLWTLAIAVGVMLAAGLAASYIPALRAANVQPMDALRNE